MNHSTYGAKQRLTPSLTCFLCFYPFSTFPTSSLALFTPSLFPTSLRLSHPPPFTTICSQLSVLAQIVDDHVSASSADSVRDVANRRESFRAGLVPSSGGNGDGVGSTAKLRGGGTFRTSQKRFPQLEKETAGSFSSTSSRAHEYSSGHADFSSDCAAPNKEVPHDIERAFARASVAMGSGRFGVVDGEAVRGAADAGMLAKSASAGGAAGCLNISGGADGSNRPAVRSVFSFGCYQFFQI